MSGLIKYRVHEVAKDFGMTSKEITQILTDYATTPKNHMQVLEDDEEYQNPVDLLFEELAKKKPNSFAMRQYKLYKLAAGVIR